MLRIVRAEPTNSLATFSAISRHDLTGMSLEDAYVDVCVRGQIVVSEVNSIEGSLAEAGEGCPA
jgi:hypothetical protein